MTIYLDNNATTAASAEVIEVLGEALATLPGNPSSIHRVGRMARNRLDAAREEAAEVLGAEPEEVVFTGSGSEADTLAILGAVEAAPADRRHLVVSSVEHPAVLRAAEATVEHLGASLTLVPPGSDGIVPAEAMLEALREDTLLCSLMLANNETGALMPVARVGAACRERGVLFHCDAVQAVGKVPVDLGSSEADLLSVSGHKLHGPKGVGLLVRRKGTRLHPVIRGGGQEHGLRPGTENLASIVALAAALGLAREGLEAGEAETIAARRDRLEQGLLALHGPAAVNGPTAPGTRLPNTTNLSFPGIEAEALLIGLDREGICVSTGSACASGSVEPSHVLRAMQLSPARLASSLRISLSRYTTDEEIDRVLEVMAGLLARLA
ncbi:MAG: cysteine desulfurase family protein [Deltaproteobacteria bacterium]|nr:cysteine desulfurase family protein [Deltaproteobacteria bacterium]